MPPQTVRLWDTRKLSSHLHEYDRHTDAITAVQWSPRAPEIFISTSADHNAMVWDNRRIGEKQQKDCEREGPPELMFVHAGHITRISDVSWDASDQWMVASVAEDNMVHVWSMDQKICCEEPDANNMID